MKIFIWNRFLIQASNIPAHCVNYFLRESTFLAKESTFAAAESTFAAAESTAAATGATAESTFAAAESVAAAEVSPPLLQAAKAAAIANTKSTFFIF
jgi:hypothetical protein